MRKIALEEHFVTPELAKYGACTSPVAQHETGRTGRSKRGASYLVRAHEFRPA